MENSTKDKANNWKYFIGIGIGIILYKIFSDYIYPLLAN